LTVKAQALLDTNVIVAALAPDHPEHAQSIALFERTRDGELAVPAHAVSEAYSTLTRANGLFRWSPADAWSTINSILRIAMLVGQSPLATVDAVRTFAEQGGVGPRLYDRLIGEVAIQHRIGTIITWNIAHMHTLFPQLAVIKPEQFASQLRRR
jgi:predicted nucleic acid-binding protein